MADASPDTADAEKAKLTRLEKREGWLREEIKNHRGHLFSLVQWGITLLAALESSLYFVRRDLAQALMRNQFTVPAEAFSVGRWGFGTLLLLLVCMLFSFLYLNLLNRYYDYRDQLNAASGEYSGISDGVVKRKLKWLPLVFFWAFPLIDLAVWVSFHKK